MNIQAQKSLVMEQFNQVNDINLINAVKSMLDYAIKKEAEVFDIPEEHKALVRNRIKAAEENPERIIDWEKAKHMIKL